METSKRSFDTVEGATETADDEWIGPMPSEAIVSKKRKVLQFENVYLENLPCSETYEKSYMHKDVVTHVAVTKTDFIITASCDAHVKFWKKNEDESIEFVKHFRSHLGNIQDMAVSYNGEMCATISDDKSCKVYDVINFGARREIFHHLPGHEIRDSVFYNTELLKDMINMMKLGYTPLCCGWIYSSGDAIAALAISEQDNSKIHIYDGRGSAEPIKTIDKLHYKPVTIISFNSVYEVCVSADQSGMIEYWTGPKKDYSFPKTVDWQYKTDTDLYEFVKCKCVPVCLRISPDGKLLATIAKDRKVRIFKFLTGKLSKVLDESLQQFTELQQMKQQLPNMEFGRRLALERELEKSESFKMCNLVFDESGFFLLYATMLGVKVINLHTNRCVKIFGKPENMRFIQLALFQGSGKKQKAAVDIEMAASDNPILQNVTYDPILFCTAYKKNRFYMFSRREPEDTKSGDTDRDVFNEKPSKEEVLAATQDTSYTRVSENVIIHTSLGDIHCKLFPKECPKTVENFCVHGRNGYFNGHLFHRVIKSFMLQTGDPLGNGTGGESIWGGEFEDEFHPNLRHDRPYTLSMANAGPNSNGSQFFITVVPCPWLDNKHTVFGRVVKGMEVVQKIGSVKTNPKTDKPHDDIHIISVTVK